MTSPTPWRVGRKVGRTIYSVDAKSDTGDGRLIGVMDTREDAALVVAAVNEYRDLRAMLGDLLVWRIAVSGGVVVNDVETEALWRRAAALSAGREKPAGQDGNGDHG